MVRNFTDIYVGLLFKLSFAMRRNPARFLYHDRAFQWLNLYIKAELPFFSRAWDGPIWDVGASVGKYTALLAKANPDRTVFAFEPNLNSVYYLAYRTSHCKNVTIVPSALTADGAPIPGSIDPDFGAPPTGPACVTFSLPEAIAKFGTPSFIKMDIEGEEFRLFDHPRTHPLLANTTILVTWHSQFTPTNRPIPQLPGWTSTRIADDETLLPPLHDDPPLDGVRRI